MAPRLDPEVAAEVMRAAGLAPLVMYPGADTPWPCTCTTCGGQIAPRLSGVRGGRGCRLCYEARRGVTLRGDASRAVDDMRRAGVEPLDPYRRGNAQWRCLCTTCDREVTPHLFNVRAGQAACAYCARKKVDPAEALAVMRSVGLEPTGDYPGAGRHWPSECLSCGRVAESVTYNHVVSRGSGCSPCGKVRAGLNRRIRLAAKAIVVMQQAGVEPLEDYPGTDTPWLSRCLACNSEVTPKLANVRAGQGGCRLCAKHGFNARDVAYVYLVSDETSGAIKAGICGTSTSRLKWYANHGWDLLARVEMSGSAARRVEKAVISWWRQGLGLPPYLSKGDLPYAGWTETVDADAIDIPATIARIKELAAEAA